MKWKLNRQGNIIFAFMVVILLLTSIYITSAIVIANRYQSVVMYNKVKEQYLAESLVDIQRSLLKTKLENTKLTVMFKRIDGEYDYVVDGTPQIETGYEAQTSVYLFDGYPVEIVDGAGSTEGIVFIDENGDNILDGYSPIIDGYTGELEPINISNTGNIGWVPTESNYSNENIERKIAFTNISIESMDFLRKEDGLGKKSFIKNLYSELKLVYPSTKEGLRISNLCLNTQFWVDLDNWGIDDNSTRRGKINTLVFESTVTYVGGKIVTLFEVDNVYFERNLFKHSIGATEDVGTAETWINVDNMEVNILDYKIIPDGGSK